MIKKRFKIGAVIIAVISVLSIFAYKNIYAKKVNIAKKPIVVKTKDWQVIAEIPKEK